MCMRRSSMRCFLSLCLRVSLRNIVDANQDGSISLLEFNRAYKQHPDIFSTQNPIMKLPGLKDSANLKASALSPIEYFHAIDTDGNGQLSLRELTAALKVNHMSREAIRAIFDTCDRDKSGSISLIEWMRMTKEKGELLPSKVSGWFIHRRLAILCLCPSVHSSADSPNVVAQLERPPAFISAVAPMDLFAEMDKVSPAHPPVL
jgi:hypothetical protein